MIRPYQPSDRLPLCDFFSDIIENHKEYISHGEIQMGVALDSGLLSPDYRQKWLQYLDRQTANPQNTLLIYEEESRIKGFILFGIAKDGDSPYGVVFDLSITPKERGKHLGFKLLQLALDSFREKGINDCYLESGVDNHAAHSFFQKQGFRHISNIFRLKL